ncbi:MAG: DUF6263 family protein [Prevotellaceae bacterium]|jgi:hypothetical protein|nr:DUF6263 family protein [Prevotellaceae bacterium]
MKHLIFKISTLSLVLISVLFSCGNSGDKITLEYNLKQGEILKQNVVMNMDLVQKLGEQEMKISLVSEMKMAFEIRESQKDGYAMEIKVKGIKMTAGVPGMGNLSFDSNTDKDVATQADLGPMFKAIIDKPIESVMTKTGKLQSVKGLDKFMEAMINSFGEDTSEDVRQQITGQLGSQFSEEAFKSQLEQGLGFFPDRPVGTGDSWDYKMTTNASNFTMNIDMKSTLKSIEGNVVSIDVNGTVSTPGGESEQEISGIKAKISLNGTQKGTLKVNRDTGWVISSDLAMNFNGNMEVMGMKIPVYAASTIKVTGE